MNKACPRCVGEIEPVTSVDWDNLRCNQCGGAWIDEYTLQSLWKNGPPPLMRGNPCPDFCPVCSSVPLDDALLLDTPTLHCPSCKGTFIPEPELLKRQLQEDAEYDASNAEILDGLPHAMTHTSEQQAISQPTIQEEPLAATPPATAQTPHEEAGSSEENDSNKETHSIETTVDSPINENQQTSKPNSSTPNQGPPPPNIGAHTTTLSRKIPSGVTKAPQVGMWTSQVGQALPKQQKISRGEQIWIASLILAIISSLLYWMTPV